MCTRINIEGEFKSNFYGYCKLIELFTQIKLENNTYIILDFRHCSFFEANLSSILGAIINYYTSRGYTIKIKELPSAIENILLRNKFLQTFENRSIIDVKGTTLAYKQIKPENEELFQQYVENELLTKKEFPQLSTKAQKKIGESIFELFENARTHGKCKYVYICGQYYPNQTPARIDLTIVDLGYSIKRSVNKYLKTTFTGIEAIEWAIKNGNTTKTGTLPGGLGLNIIIDFINKNEGKLQIISADGYWENYKEITKTRCFLNSFPGTIANIKFNLDDNKSYISKEEAKKIIF